MSYITSNLLATDIPHETSKLSLPHDTVCECVYEYIDVICVCDYVCLCACVCESVVIKICFMHAMMGLDSHFTIPNQIHRLVLFVNIILL